MYSSKFTLVRTLIGSLSSDLSLLYSKKNFPLTLMNNNNNNTLRSQKNYVYHLSKTFVFGVYYIFFLCFI